MFPSHYQCFEYEMYICPDFQLDPPDSQFLYLKGGSLSFLFEHTWVLSGTQFGRYQRILLTYIFQGLIIVVSLTFSALKTALLLTV